MKKILMIGVLLWVNINVFAQADNDVDKDDQIKALKIAYITKQLDLTPDEAQKFWPVFNQYETELKKVRQGNKGGEIEREEAELNVRKQFKPNFLKAISAEKVEKLWRVHRGFENIVRKEIIRRKMLQRRRR